MSSLYPIYVDLTDRDVLVVGGGTVAARKVAGLLESGANITVVAPQACGELARLGNEGKVRILRRSYNTSDLEDKWLAIAATDDAELNKAVSVDASRRRLFCNVVDCAALCSFQVPAVLRRGLLQIAISTGGASPALARRARMELEGIFGPAYGQLVDALLELRDHLRRKYPTDQARREQLLECFLDSGAPDLLLQDDPEAFPAELERWKSR